jgi:hypothetical protein
MNPTLWAALQKNAKGSYEAADGYDNRARAAKGTAGAGELHARANRRRREAIFSTCLLELRDAFEAAMAPARTVSVVTVPCERCCTPLVVTSHPDLVCPHCGFGSVVRP